MAVLPAPSLDPPGWTTHRVSNRFNSLAVSLKTSRFSNRGVVSNAYVVDHAVQTSMQSSNRHELDDDAELCINSEHACSASTIPLVRLVASTDDDDDQTTRSKSNKADSGSSEVPDLARFSFIKCGTTLSLQALAGGKRG